MPVTAKLSKQFYDRFGESVTNELVDWFNQVDAAYKSDLRDINELNFARFDAKLEQRLAEFDAKLEHRFAESDVKLEHRFAEYDVKLERRFAESDVKFERRFAEYDVKLEQRAAELRVDMRGLELSLERTLREQTRFFFLAWAVLLASNIALWFR